MRSHAPASISADDDINPPADWYLDDGFNVPVTPRNDQRGEVLRRIFEVGARRMKRSVSVLVNVALRWDLFHKGVGVDPDVMWVEPALPEGMRSVLTWMPDVKAPRIAVEIVSKENADKDYRRGPAKYGASGTQELWVFDPEGLGRDEKEQGPWALQVWRRDRRGKFRRVYAGDGPEYSQELDAWIVVAGDLLRVADDENGTQLWPTTDEERDDAEERAVLAEERAVLAEERAVLAEERAVLAEERAAAEAKARVVLEAKLRALESQRDRAARKRR
jgi:hypothetical protein